MQTYRTKEVRRMDLALALIQREVRTKAVCLWSGLPRTKVQKLRRDLAHEAPKIRLGRRSGPFPRKMREFLRSPRTRNEAAAFCGLCRAYGVIPPRPEPDAARYLPTVARGEQIVLLHDIYRELVPSTKISCEQMMSLLMTLVSGETYDIGRCERSPCWAAILIDPLSVTARRFCMLCMHVPKSGMPRELTEPSRDAKDLPHNIQVTLFELMETEAGKRAQPVKTQAARGASIKRRSSPDAALDTAVHPKPAEQCHNTPQTPESDS